MKYPLSEVPLSIAHGDGSRRKTNKSALFDVVLNATYSVTTNAVKEGIEVYILDLAAQIRSTINIPKTFEELALRIFKEISQRYDIVYVACDTYKSSSIKSPERRLRGESNAFLIRSEKVQIPPNFQDFLSNGSNKERLFSMIEDTWIKNRAMLNEREVYFAKDCSCVKITRDGCFTIDELRTDHEEADTKVAYLISHALRTYSNIREVCVRSCSGDIDIPVILIGIFGGCENAFITLDNGTGKYRKKIEITRCTLSRKQQKALVGFHAFTGNDYLSSFLRKSKKIWGSIVENDEELLDFFVSLGEGQVNDALDLAAEKFVCRIYGEKKIESVINLRSKLFWNKLKKYEKFSDLSLLPPCSSTLTKHSTRANYLCQLWRKADFPMLNMDPFANNGWFSDGTIHWIDNPYPEDVKILFLKAEEKDDNRNSVDTISVGVYDIDFENIDDDLTDLEDDN